MLRNSFQVTELAPRIGFRLCQTDLKYLILYLLAGYPSSVDSKAWALPLQEFFHWFPGSAVLQIGM